MEVGHGSNCTVYRMTATPVPGQQQHSPSTTNGANAKTAMVIAAKVASSDEASARIKEELQHYTTVGQHPHLLPVLQATEVDGKFCLLTPFVSASLQDILDKRRPRTEGPYADAVFVSNALFRALAHLARSDKVHRDCKPSNILVDEQKKEGGGAASVTGCYLIDLDILSSADNKHPHDRFFGSYGFASPEAVAGAQTIGTSSDVFCAGAVVASMILPDQIFRLAPGDKKMIRKRLLESFTSVLGALGEDALKEMDLELQDFETPKKLPSDGTKIESLLKESGLPTDKVQFYLEFLLKCFQFKPSSRPTAFKAFKLMYGQASEEERGRMPPLNDAEKEEADIVCGGREQAKLYFSTVYK